MVSYRCRRCRSLWKRARAPKAEKTSRRQAAPRFRPVRGGRRKTRPFGTFSLGLAHRPGDLPGVAGRLPSQWRCSSRQRRQAEPLPRRESAEGGQSFVRGLRNALYVRLEGSDQQGGDAGLRQRLGRNVPGPIHLQVPAGQRPAGTCRGRLLYRPNGHKGSAQPLRAVRQHLRDRRGALQPARAGAAARGDRRSGRRPDDALVRRQVRRRGLGGRLGGVCISCGLGVYDAPGGGVGGDGLRPGHVRLVDQLPSIVAARAERILPGLGDVPSDADP